MARTFAERCATEEAFRVRMRPYAVEIFEKLFPGCRIEELRQDGEQVHVLDKEFGIDAMVVLPSGQWLSIQEKYRHNKYLVNPSFQVCAGIPDFTQEYKNAVGTPHESDGEWFKLAAQLYFYGWANKSATGFAKWVLIDIAKYKMLVEQAGGLHRIGKLRFNRGCGKASFYAIPVTRLAPAFVADYRSPYFLKCRR